MLAYNTTAVPVNPPAWPHQQFTTVPQHGFATHQRTHRTAQGSHTRMASINSTWNRIATQTSPKAPGPAGGRSHVPSAGEAGPCTSRPLATLRAETRRRIRPRPRPGATPPPEPPARRTPLTPPPPEAEACGREAVASCSGGEAVVAIAARAVDECLRDACDAMSDD